MRDCRRAGHLSLALSCIKAGLENTELPRLILRTFLKSKVNFYPCIEEASLIFMEGIPSGILE